MCRRPRAPPAGASGRDRRVDAGASVERGFRRIYWTIGDHTAPADSRYRLLDEFGLRLLEPDNAVMVLREAPPAGPAIECRPVASLAEYAAADELKADAFAFGGDIRAARPANRDAAWGRYSQADDWLIYAAWDGKKPMAVVDVAFTPFGAFLFGAANLTCIPRPRYLPCSDTHPLGRSSATRHCAPCSPRSRNVSAHPPS